MISCGSQFFGNRFLQTLFLSASLLSRNAVSDDTPRSLPDWLPSSAIELKPDATLLIAEGGGIEEFKLNNLDTGKHYFVRVKLVNMLSKATSAKEIHSSCGCMVAASSSEIVEPKSESHFVAYIKPQLNSGPYGKTVTVTFDSGVKLMVLLTATFVSPFSLERHSAVIPEEMKTLEMAVMLNAPMERLQQLGFETEMGYLKCPEQTFPKDDYGRHVLKLDVSDEMHKHLRVAGTLVEVVKVIDRGTKKPICALSISLRSESVFRIKPSRVVLKKVGDKFIGEVLVFGDWEMHPVKENELVLLDLRDSVPLDLSIAVKATNKKFAKLEFSTQSKLVTPEGSNFVVSNGEFHFGFLDSLVFDGE